MSSEQQAMRKQWLKKTCIIFISLTAEPFLQSPVFGSTENLILLFPFIRRTWIFVLIVKILAIGGFLRRKTFDELAWIQKVMKVMLIFGPGMCRLKNVCHCCSGLNLHRCAFLDCFHVYIKYKYKYECTVDIYTDTSNECDEIHSALDFSVWQKQFIFRNVLNVNHNCLERLVGRSVGPTCTVNRLKFSCYIVHILWVVLFNYVLVRSKEPIISRGSLRSLFK